MTEKISHTIEDYLGMIYVLERDEEPVVGARLAEIFAVTPPTVTNTLKRMVRDGLLENSSKSGPHLTEHGLEAGRSVMRRHMLAEWMLSRMLPWAKVHKEAHLFEHAISAELEEAILAEFNYPELCPHGNPLPGHEDVVASWVPITRLPEGECGIVRRVHELAEEIPELLGYLDKNGIHLGCKVKVVSVLSFNQTITIDAEGSPVILGFAVARYLYVEKIKPEATGAIMRVAEREAVPAGVPR